MYPVTPISSVSQSIYLPSAVDSGRDAVPIASPANENLTNPLLYSSQSLLLAQAGAEVVSTSNEMLGTLLDVYA
jgi:hypothetical protein